jgi:hypothetical protein
MIKSGNYSFYFDLERMNEVIHNREDLKAGCIEDVTEYIKYDSEGKVLNKTIIKKKKHKEELYDGPLYEMISNMIFALMGMDYDDDTINIDFENMSFNNKLIFNTLLNLGIIKYK